MATEPEIMKVSSDEFDKDPERYRAQATPGHIVQVIEPSGGTTVIMSEQDFEGYKATIELLSNPV
jgi:PHD/YefM family antitoxin component YafN of YafNO toxin-antitoxin module